MHRFWQNLSLCVLYGEGYEKLSCHKLYTLELITLTHLMSTYYHAHAFFSLPWHIPKLKQGTGFHINLLTRDYDPDGVNFLHMDWIK